VSDAEPTLVDKSGLFSQFILFILDLVGVVAILHQTVGEIQPTDSFVG
jgi:hypothetical protein